MLRGMNLICFLQGLTWDIDLEVNADEAIEAVRLDREAERGYVREAGSVSPLNQPHIANRGAVIDAPQ